MTEIEKQFLDELLFCIKENDLQKSYALLQFIPSMSPEIQNRALFEINNANDSLSYSMFEYLMRVRIDDDEVRNKLYEIILDKGRVNNEFFYIYIRMAHEKEMKEAVPVLLDILTTETNIGILMETIRALASIKTTSAIKALTEFIYYNDEMLKREAVMALEKIGGTAARENLEFAARTTKSSPLIIAVIDRLRKKEKLPPFVYKKPPIDEIKLNEPEEAPKTPAVEEKIEEIIPEEIPVEVPPEKVNKEIEIEVPDEIKNLIDMFNSDSYEQRHKAIDSLIDVGEDCIPAVVHNMDTEDSNNLINSLDILGNIGSKTAASPIFKVIDLQHEDSNVRFAAFEAIERLPKLKSALVLTEGITDPSQQVRIAAAAAINKNLSDVLIAGLRSMIDAGDKNSKTVIEAIIDARASNTFEKLLESDAFTFGFSNYLTQDAAPETREYFTDLLKKRGNRTLAGRIEFDTQKDRVKDRKVIFAVDDSRILLNYYIKELHKMGHSPQVYADPNKALEMMIRSKPAVVITDLNMLEINGIQFSRSIREVYPESLLPVVVATTQSDFIEKTKNGDAELKKELEDAGVSMVLKKPIKTDKIIPLIEKDDDIDVFSEFFYTLSSDLPDVRYKSTRNVLENTETHIIDIADSVTEEPSDININKLNILAESKDQSCFEKIKMLASKNPKDSNLRFAIYNAFLNTVPKYYDMDEEFTELIEDNAEHSRIALARILNLKSKPSIINKLKEMIETGSRSARMIVGSIIDSRSDRLFSSLLTSDAFTYVATDYLARSASPSHKDFFLAILKLRGNNSLARSVERDSEDLPVNSKKIMVVEDSKIMQDYFISRLHASGFKVSIVDKPLNTMLEIFSEKPDLIITSFNLPGISGIQMAENIRKDLPPEDLPIVMATSQKDFVENATNADSVYRQHIASKGIDRIFLNPLKNKDIEVIRSLIT